MRFLATLALLAIGFGAGWTFRDSQPDDGPSRAERQEANRTTEPVVEETPEDLPPAYAPKKEVATPPAETVAADATPLTAPEAEEEPEAEQDPEAAKLAKFMRSMLPLMKMQSSSEGRARARELAELLQLDERREQQVAELISNDMVRKLEEGLLPMLEGKEPDAAMLANMQETDGMTKALHDELSLVLNANEMDTVTTHFREQRKERQRQAVEAQVKGLAIPDLNADQERQLREILMAEDEQRASIQSGPTSGSDSGFRMKMKSNLTGEGLVEAVDEDYRQRREKLARFLSTEQLAHLDKRHELDREEAKAAAGAMGGMMGAIAVGRTEAPKKEG